MKKLHINTNTNMLLLPIIDTYSLHNSDDMAHFDGELEYYQCIYDKQKQELKKLISLNDIKENYYISDKILNEDVDCYELFDSNHKQFEIDCIAVLNEFVNDFINVLNKQFPKFIVENSISDKLNKPKEYNFKTDITETKFIINSDVLVKVIEFFKCELCIKNENSLEKYLKNNYSSYDGFWSFIANNINDFLIEIENYNNEINTDSGEFDIMLGIIYHYLINDNSIENIENSISNLQEEFNNYIYDSVYVSLVPTEKFNENYYYSYDELENIIFNNIIRLKEKHYRKKQLKIF